MHGYAFLCTLGSPKAPRRVEAELPSMYQNAMIILLSVQQTRESTTIPPLIHTWSVL